MNELYEHQKAALRKLSNGKVLWGGVGTGKTRVATEYYKLKEAPRDVYVITTARKRDSLDWEREFLDVGVGSRSGPASLSQRGQKKNRSADTISRTPPGIQAEELTVPSATSPATSDDGARSGAAVAVIRGDQEAPPGWLDNDESGSRDGEAGGVDSRSSYRDSGSRGGRERTDDQRQNGTLPGGNSGDDSTAGGDPVGRAGRENVQTGTRGELDVRPGQYPYVLTVDSWNNIAKYADVAGAFFIFDEQRLVGAGDWSRKFLRIAKRNHWILLSATPGDTWMDYIPIFVANDFYKNRTEFKREHVVYNTFTKFPKVDRYINIARLMRQRSELLVHMPFERHTKRRHVVVPLAYDKEALERVLKDRWHVYEERPLLDVAEMFSVARKVVNSDPSRLEMVCELWKNHPKLIVFYNFNYELESLRSLSSYYGISEPNSNIGAPTARSAGISTTTNHPSTMMPVLGVKSGSLRDSTRSKINTSPLNENLPSTRHSNLGSEPWKTNSESVSSKPGSSAKCVKPSTLQQTNGPRGSSTGGLLGPSGKPISTGSPPGSSTETHPSPLSSMSIAEWNGHKHQPIPSTDRWLYLCQYTAAAEAWNCIDTDAMIMYSQNYSWKVTEQAYGRIDRLNTPFTDLWYYGFTSDSWVDRAIGRSLQAKESFNVKKFKGMFEG